MDSHTQNSIKLADQPVDNLVESYSEAESELSPSITQYQVGSQSSL